MKALVFDGSLRLVTDYPQSTPAPNEALVKVKLAGVCNTDIEITKGYMGFKGVVGHEFVGIVEACQWEDIVGRRVVAEINLSCGACSFCTSGLANHCPNRSVLGILNHDGVMAEYVTLPIENLHPVPDSIPDDEAVLTEPVAAAFEILEQVSIKPTDSIVVLGDGKLGLLVAQVLAGVNHNVRAVGKYPHKLAILSERGIETHLLDEAPQERSSVVVDCTGSASGFEMAMRLVRPRGVIVLKSTAAGGASLNLAPLVVDEVTVVGSRCGPFAPALKALASKKIDARSLIVAEYPIDDGLRAFEEAGRKGALKVLIRC